MNELDITKVKQFWHNRAQHKELEEIEITHRDIWQRWLEIELIKQYLKPNVRMLDVGCGTGFATRIYSSIVKEIIGMDYDEAMIQRAKNELKALNKQDSSNIQFYVQDVLHLSPESFGFFDIALTCRCFINLKSHMEQRRAIDNITSVLKPDGHFLFIEGGKKGRTALNTLREAVGLEKMPEVWHNIDFDEEETIQYLKKYYVIEERLYFGLYDFLSRVVHPLTVAPEQPKYKSKNNEIAAKLNIAMEGFENISRIIFLILRKKDGV